MVYGSDQLYAGFSSGIEGATHAMNSLLPTHNNIDPDWGMLMVRTVRLKSIML